MFKGALHVHSTYSDGEFTLAELRKVFLRARCSFVGMTDHAESFDAPKLRAYREECQSLSNSEFQFIVGLEYECENRMHILGYGAKELVTGKDPEVVIQHIQAEGAISVIAHPKDDFFPWIRSFRTLPQGIEGWNSKYDGKHAPRPQTFQLVQELKERDPGIHAFYGQDLHWRNQFRELFVLVECDVPRPEQILRALAAGRFRGQKDNLELPSSGVLPNDLLLRFEATHTKSARMRQGLKQGKKMLDRAGIKIPSRIKSQLRRIF